MSAINEDPALPRRAFVEAARQFAEMAAKAPDDGWEAPALGRWSVRELVGHVVWVMRVVERTVSQPAGRIEVPHAADYFLRSIRKNGQVGDPASIASQGVEAGKALGEKPGEAARAAMEGILKKLAGVRDDALVRTYHGGMRLNAYVPAPTLELTVHLLDLGAALGQEVEPAEPARRVSLLMLAELAAQPGRFAPVARALTGRGRLPDGFALMV